MESFIFISAFIDSMPIQLLCTTVPENCKEYEVRLLDKINGFGLQHKSIIIFHYYYCGECKKSEAC